METNTLINFQRLQAALLDYAQTAREVYKEQIALGGHNASRHLADTVGSNVVVDGKAYEVRLQLEYYWKFLEYGSKGTESSYPGAKYPAHFPPPSEILKWIQIKPVIPKPMPLPNGKFRIPSLESLSWIISKNILKHGTEPFPAVEATKEELMQIYEQRLSEALGMDVSDYLARILKEK